MTVNEAYEIMRGNDAVLTRFMTNTSGEPSRTGVLPDVTRKDARRRPGLDARSREGSREHDVQSADADSRRFLDTMSQMLRTFRGVDGRKTIILFSEGFHSDNVSRDDRRRRRRGRRDVFRRLRLRSESPHRRPEHLVANRHRHPDGNQQPAGAAGNVIGGHQRQLVKDAMSRLDDALDSLGAAELDYYVLGFPRSVGRTGRSE